MDKIILSASVRDTEKDKLSDLRSKSIIPAVLYGAGKENINLMVNKSEFGRIYKVAGGNSIVELQINEKDNENVLICDIQINPVTDEVDHIDLMRVRMDEEITATVPLEFIGMSIAVKDFGGIFNAGMNDIEVTCLPGVLPKVIEVNMDLLKTFDDVIRVKDLVLPEGVTVSREEEEVIASVLEPRSEEELAALNEDVNEDLEKVEVEEKGKKEEEVVEGEEKK